MKMMRILLVVLSLGMYSYSHAETETRADGLAALTLESELVKFVDGKSGLGIDGQTFGMLMKLRITLKSMQLGIKQTDGSLVGYYTYQDKKYTTKDFIALEAAGTKTSTELNTALNDFNKKVQPLLEMSRGAKQNMVDLISEWAKLAKRPHTQLLNWAHTPEGQEQKELAMRITSFTEYDNFISDLIYFLETLMRSCPKAHHQFKELIKQQMPPK